MTAVAIDAEDILSVRRVCNAPSGDWTPAIVGQCLSLPEAFDKAYDTEEEARKAITELRKAAGEVPPSPPVEAPAN